MRTHLISPNGSCMAFPVLTRPAPAPEPSPDLNPKLNPTPNRPAPAPEPHADNSQTHLSTGCPCIAHTNCPAGKYTKVVGNATAQPQCETCPAGLFKASESSSSTKTDSCIAHTNCPAGKYTKTVGNASAQPQCETCPAGFFKSTASKYSIVSGCKKYGTSKFTAIVRCRMNCGGAELCGTIFSDVNMLLRGVAFTPLGVVSSADTWSDQLLWSVDDPLYNLQACFTITSLVGVDGHEATRMFGNVNIEKPAAKECQTHATTICRERKLSVFWQTQVAEGCSAAASTDAGPTWVFTHTAFASLVLFLKNLITTSFVHFISPILYDQVYSATVG